jgi:hypothetical protein
MSIHSSGTSSFSQSSGTSSSSQSSGTSSSSQSSENPFLTTSVPSGPQITIDIPDDKDIKRGEPTCTTLKGIRCTMTITKLANNSTTPEKCNSYVFPYGRKKSIDVHLAIDEPMPEKRLDFIDKKNLIMDASSYTYYFWEESGIPCNIIIEWGNEKIEQDKYPAIFKEGFKNGKERFREGVVALSINQLENLHNVLTDKNQIKMEVINDKNSTRLFLIIDKLEDDTLIENNNNNEEFFDNNNRGNIKEISKVIKEKKLGSVDTILQKR